VAWAVEMYCRVVGWPTIRYSRNWLHTRKTQLDTTVTPPNADFMVHHVSRHLGSKVSPLPTTAMLSKRARGDDPESVPPARRLRGNIADLFLSSSISGARAASLFRDAASSGSAGVDDLASTRQDRNAHRNLLRRLLKHSRWPPLHYASIRVMNPKTHQEDTASIPFLLPHELVCVMRKSCLQPEVFFDRAGMDPTTRTHLERATGELGIEGDVLGLGLWMDGVACKWDRSQSVDMITMRLPGLAAKWANLRLPLAVIDHFWICKEHTFDDMLAVIAWSLRHATLDCHPAVRHDRTPWWDSDAKRRCLAGTLVGCSALLCQISGDWKMYKEIFRFPQHNEVAGCCFKCRVTPDGIRDTTTEAA